MNRKVPWVRIPPSPLKANLPIETNPNGLIRFVLPIAQDLLGDFALYIGFRCSKAHKPREDGQ